MSENIVFEGTPKVIDRARAALPWLVKYAESGKLATYGELGEKIVVDPHVELKHILGCIGEALTKARPSIPKLWLLIVNKKTGVVGNQGLGWLVATEVIPTLSPENIRLLCEGAQKEVFEYQHWGEILVKAGLEPRSLGPPLETLLEEAVALESDGKPGEGNDHFNLKHYVASESKVYRPQARLHLPLNRVPAVVR